MLRSTSFRYGKKQAIQGSAVRFILKNSSLKGRCFSERLRRPSYPCRGLKKVSTFEASGRAVRILRTGK